MKIALLSNYYNHHISGLVQSLERNENVDEVVFISCESVPENRLSLGYSTSFDIKNHLDIRQQYEEVKNCIMNYDVVIASYDNRELLKKRVQKGLLTFIYSERIFKSLDDSLYEKAKQFFRWIKYKFIIMQDGLITDNVYFLCVGQYSVADYIRLGVDQRHTLLWGYFPQLSNKDERSYSQKDKVSCVWCGRLLRQKRPDQAIRVVKRLCDEGFNINLTLIGEGEMQARLVEMSKGYPIVFNGSVKYTEVRDWYRKSDIFLFTSNFWEGWGAVLSEAMSEGLAVIVSAQTGAAIMVEDGENGLLYDGSDEQLYIKLKCYLLDYDLRVSCARKARTTLEKTWNSKTATDRFVEVCGCLKNGREWYYESGPLKKPEEKRG